MKSPYYSDDYCTIYNCDFIEILDELPKFDLLLTDPPYGIGEANGKNKSRVQLAMPTDYGNESWDDEKIKQEYIYKLINKCDKSIIFGGNYYCLTPSSCWLVWDKCNGNSDFADCELAWTNLSGAVRMYKHQWNGMLRKHKEKRFHPTQKPEDVMSWCISVAGNLETILDPFMGSGTTLVSAKVRNIKQSVGIEISEKYCEIAAMRLSQGVLNL